MRKKSRRREQQKRNASPGGLCCREPQVRRCCAKNAGAPGSTPSGAPAPSPAKVPVRLQTPCLVLRSKQGRGVWRGRFGWGWFALSGKVQGWHRLRASLAWGSHARARARARGHPGRGGKIGRTARWGARSTRDCRLWAACPLPLACDSQFRDSQGVNSFSFPSRAFPGFRLVKRRAYCPTL